MPLQHYEGKRRLFFEIVCHAHDELPGNFLAHGILSSLTPVERW
jgi:hypothetical protein